MVEKLDSIISVIPFLILIVIVLGFFISELFASFPSSELRSIVLFGLDKQIQVR